MEHGQHARAQRTRERLRTAAHRLFLQQGYLATSVDTILAEAGISSKETLYRHYANKEALFADVLSHLTLSQPEFVERYASLPAPHDLPSLHQTLTLLAREILSLMCQPGYLPLVRMILAEAPRFPELGTLFFATVPQRGLSLLTAVLTDARQQQIIADVDANASAHMLLGALLTNAVMNRVLADEPLPPPLERADAVVAVLMRALAP